MGISASLRLGAGTAKRSFADLKDWARECVKDAWKEAKTPFKWALGLALAWSLADAGYRLADRKDRVTHNQNTPVWVQGDWTVGEYRNCDMPLGSTRLFCGKSPVDGSGVAAFPESVSDGDLPAAVVAAYNRETQTDWSALDRYFNFLPVSFYGRLQRAERNQLMATFSWRCQRTTKRLTCEPLDSEAPLPAPSATQ